MDDGRHPGTKWWLAILVAALLLLVGGVAGYAFRGPAKPLRRLTGRSRVQRDLLGSWT